MIPFREERSLCRQLSQAKPEGERRPQIKQLVLRQTGMELKQAGQR